MQCHQHSCGMNCFHCTVLQTNARVGTCYHNVMFRYAKHTFFMFTEERYAERCHTGTFIIFINLADCISIMVLSVVLWGYQFWCSPFWNMTQYYTEINNYPLFYSQKNNVESQKYRPGRDISQFLHKDTVTSEFVSFITCQTKENFILHRCVKQETCAYLEMFWMIMKMFPNV